MGRPIICIFLCAMWPLVPQVEGSWDIYTMPPPQLPDWLTWQEQLGNSHLTSLTAELVRDSTLRMRAVNVAGKLYEKNLVYKIGAITASIQGLFTRMISIYRDVSNLTAIRHFEWYREDSIDDTITAISMAQSLLHRIRLEKQLFLEITRKDQEEKMADYNAMVSKFGKPPAGNSDKQTELPFKPMLGGMYVPRRSNSWYEDKFDAKFNFDSVLSKRLLEETLTPKKVVAKPKNIYNKQNESKTPEKLPILGQKLESRRAGNSSLNPYSDLYRLLGDSGARHQPALLKLIPPSGRQPPVDKQSRVSKPNPRDNVEQKPSRRSSDGAMRSWESSRTFQNVNNPNKKPLWQAPTHIQHPYGSNPTINKQFTNNLHLNDNKKTTALAISKLNLVTNIMAAETKRLLHTTKSRTYDNKSSPKMSTNKIVESSTQTVQKNAKTVTEHNSNRRVSDGQNTVTKRPLWQPGPSKQQTDKNNAEVSVQHDSSQSNGEMWMRIEPEKEKQTFMSNHKLQQTTVKNNAELSVNRQEYVGAKRPIWQPGRNLRRAYGINERYGENRGERSIKRYWKPENNQPNNDLAIVTQTTVKNNAQANVREYRKERMRPLWRPGQNYRRSFDENGDANDRLSGQRYQENRGERAIKPYWKQESNQPSPWLYQHSGKATVKQITYRNNHELSASVMPQIWEPGQHFRRSYDDNEYKIRQPIKNNAGLSEPQNYRIHESIGERRIRKPPQHLLSERSFMYEKFNQKTGNDAGANVKPNFDRREIRQESGRKSIWQPGLIGERTYYDNV